MPVGGLRKRRRDRNLAAGLRQKPKWRIQASCESRSRLTVAGKKITRRGTVAWRKRNIFRRTGIEGNCGLRSKLTAAGIKMTRHARVAWPRERFVRKDCTRNQTEQQTPKRQNDEKRRFTGPECKNGIRNRGLRQQLRSETGIKDPGARRQLRPRIEKMLYEIFRGRIAKQVVGTPSGLRKIRKWTLWRDSPLRNGERVRVRCKSRAMWDHRPLHEL
jgi:hypothetical protein